MPCLEARRRLGARPVAVALAIACFYVGWSTWYVAHHPVVSLAHVSPTFSRQSHESATISHLQASPTGGTGYDGQFYLYIALDPLHARGYLDVPAYRYARPLYPLAARALALGRKGAVPWTLLL